MSPVTLPPDVRTGYVRRWQEIKECNINFETMSVAYVIESVNLLFFPPEKFSGSGYFVL